jgi:hypothetical protein
MAKCEQGYLCEVCGKDVEDITDSDLYLRYIMGEIRPDRLHSTPERHVRCNPTLAQFICDTAFEPVRVDGAFAKESLDAAYVREQESFVTRAWRRLQQVAQSPVHVIDYPLPEIQERWRREAERTASRPPRATDQ